MVTHAGTDRSTDADQKNVSTNADTRAAEPAPFPMRTFPAGEPVDEEGIHRLVHAFYAKVMGDRVLAPVFGREIAPQEWPAHLEKMCDFWSSVLLRTRRYGGRPLPPHLALADISDAHFARWLALFRETAHEVMTPDGARIVTAMAERIAHSFRLAVAFHRGEDTTAIVPLPAE